MRNVLTFAAVAGAALFVAACGGGAANNTANAPADNGAMVTNEPSMAPTNDMGAGMPADNNAMAAPMAPAANTMAPATGNATNGM